jgi:GNAT superfamily N-acetyltransferase
MVNKRKRFRDVKFPSLRIELDIVGGSIYLKTGNNKDIGSSEWTVNKEGRDMKISNFGIESKYQGKGYGHFMARILIDLARLYHCKTITLVDGASLEGFWQSLGFKDKRGCGYVVLKL